MATHEYIKKNIAAIVCLALLLVGIAQLAIGNSLPVYKNEAAYSAVESKITDDFTSEKIDSNTASERFYKNQHENMTSKYTLLDSGWFFVLASVHVAVGGVFYRFINKRRRNVHVAILYILALFNITLFIVLMDIGIIVDSDRRLFPWWADSLGIPLFSSIFLFAFAVPITLGIVAGTTTHFKSTTVRKVNKKNVKEVWQLRPRYVLLVAAFCLLLVITSSYSFRYEDAPLVAGTLLYNFILFTGYTATATRKAKTTSNSTK